VKKRRTRYWNCEGDWLRVTSKSVASRRNFIVRCAFMRITNPSGLGNKHISRWLCHFLS